MIVRRLAPRLLLTATLTLAAAAADGQPPLGRLFFTPQQRAAISAAREPALEAGTLSTPPYVALQGIVRSSRGGLLAWLDGRPIVDGESYAGMRVQIAPPGVILHRADGRRYVLPVGRTIDLNDGALREPHVRIARSGGRS